jgi:hypothetical protein
MTPARRDVKVSDVAAQSYVDQDEGRHPGERRAGDLTRVISPGRESRGSQPAWTGRVWRWRLPWPPPLTAVDLRRSDSYLTAAVAPRPRWAVRGGKENDIGLVGRPYGRTRSRTYRRCSPCARSNRGPVVLASAAASLIPAGWWLSRAPGPGPRAPSRERSMRPDRPQWARGGRPCRLSRGLPAPSHPDPACRR